MMMPPQAVPALPPGTLPAPPGFVSQPPADPPGWSQPVPVPAALAQQPSVPRPVVRLQAPDELSQAASPANAPMQADGKPALVSMPSPEQLGVGAAQPCDSSATDWSAAHRRLNQLGAVCFRLDKLAPSGWRITCLLPTAQQGQLHHVEAVAESESEAVRLVLEKAEACTAGR